jgi:hypothetical protein
MDSFLFRVCENMALIFNGEAKVFSFFLPNKIYQYPFLPHQEAEWTHQSYPFEVESIGLCFWGVGRLEACAGLSNLRRPNINPTFVVYEKTIKVSMKTKP